MSLITKISVNKDIKSFKKDLINECTTNRIVDPTVNGANNYFLNSKHTENLYTMLIRICTKHLNTFTISDYNFKLWCYYSDDKFNTGNWHNHINTATINAVLYLKVPKNNRGIDFRHNQTIYNYKPKSGDLIIFPDFLDHYPYPSFHKPRISLNLELKCNEHSREIFKLSNSC